MNETITRYLKQLNLPGMANVWADIPFTTKEEYLLKLAEAELEEKETARNERLVKAAGFPNIKALDNFEWHSGIKIPQIITPEEIKNLAFIPKKKNLMFIGAVGTGKTHLASALGLEACKNGKNVKFFTASELANTLLEKNHAGTLKNFLAGLKRLDLMIIDELGFIPFNKEASELLFRAVSDCYERRSLIITSNLEFSQWSTIFGDNRLTTALIDRLVHHSHVLIFSGTSFRLKQSMERKTGNE